MKIISNNGNEVFALDLNFQGLEQAIAAYLIPHENGVCLVECGPGSTIPSLENSLKELNFKTTDVTDVFLTHIHLDHAGASGWLSYQGTTVHVHEFGSNHMKDPEKLLISARRIYGDDMDALWGEFLPVPEEKINVLQNEMVIDINDQLKFQTIDTPGHANHHIAYRMDNILFCGDVGGVRIPGPEHIRLPMPPPEFNLEKWQISAGKLKDTIKKSHIDIIAPTHFGFFEDPESHINELKKSLVEIELWIEMNITEDDSIESINEKFLPWTLHRSRTSGISNRLIEKYEAANPSWMSSAGIYRYWNKKKQAEFQ